MENGPPTAEIAAQTTASAAGAKPFWSEDIWAIVLGMAMLALAFTAALVWSDDVSGRFSSPGKWSNDPWASMVGKGEVPLWKSSLASLVAISLLAIPAMMLTRRDNKSGAPLRITAGFWTIALLATAAFVMAGQEVVKQYGFEYVLWALVLGLVISNTIGTPAWMRGAVRGELFIKWGLVLLGAEVLIGKLLLLGLPGILVSWFVTPIVLVVTFLFGCHILKIRSPSLVMVVAADMSVCGVSAAIATAAACRAKREELSLAIALSLCFTAVMMVAMPMTLRLAGVNEIVAGAWIGGTIDSTGAVAAAGALMGGEGPDAKERAERAVKIATTVKMIQNILIGAIAFAVSVYWATKYETDADPKQPQTNLGAKQFGAEVWNRFPKFVLGFVGASIIASAIVATGSAGDSLVTASIDGITKNIRGWLFCLAFVCIGLETNFRTLLPALSGGKTVLLYVCGQAFNILLTGLMAYLVFGWLFYDAILSWLPAGTTP
ncbi:MAG TPA: putative sulfate exporter family transporter [Planctomycetaceae bacterium]|nr:putative sulfate exporter family transporter [Planctomycetaceae bacterium]